MGIFDADYSTARHCLESTMHHRIGLGHEITNELIETVSHKLAIGFDLTQSQLLELRRRELSRLEDLRNSPDVAPHLKSLDFNKYNI